MIPPFNDSGFLPPYTGENSTKMALVSPYRTTMLEFTTLFATSPERKAILRGLLAFRADMRAIGLVDGYQWLDGSFCSDIERLETRAPGDVDVVTYAHRPTHINNGEEFLKFANSHLRLFHPIVAKETYKVDAYFVDMDMKPRRIVEQASYWHGVFGHQRVTSLWKGMVRIELRCDDVPALQHLDALDAVPDQSEAADSIEMAIGEEASSQEGASNA